MGIFVFDVSHRIFESLGGLPYLVGESLGTGVAAFLAGHDPDKVAGIALLAPYNSLVDVAQAHIRILPARWLLCDRFRAEENLRSFQGQLAVLVGGKDTVVPKKFGVRLYESYAGPKRLWEFPAATHDSLMFQPPEVWKEIITFWTPKTRLAAASGNSSLAFVVSWSL